MTRKITIYNFLRLSICQCGTPIFLIKVNKHTTYISISQGWLPVLILSVQQQK